MVSPYTWSVRNFKEAETTETLVRFTPSGKPYGFRETLPEDEPGAALEVGAARSIAVEAATGRRKWVFETQAEIVSSPNLTGDRVVFGSHDESLYCLAAADGALLWKVSTDGFVYGSPAVSLSAITK